MSHSHPFFGRIWLNIGELDLIFITYRKAMKFVKFEALKWLYGTHHYTTHL